MDEKKFNWGKRIAVALAFVTVGSIAMIAGGQYAAKRKRDEQPQAAIENTIITPQQSNGIKLMSATIAPEDYEEYGVAATAESAMTLTATITPANATNKKVDWSVAWVNASSTWATGKTVTDYVTVTTATDGALTATVSCLKAFGEQIKITVTSRADSTKTASCTVDYVKRFDGGYFNVEGRAATYASNVWFGDDLNFKGGLDDDFHLDSLNIIWGAGTIENDAEISARVFVNADALEAINDLWGGDDFIVAYGAENGLDVCIGDYADTYFGDLIGYQQQQETLREYMNGADVGYFEEHLAQVQESGLSLFTLKITFTSEHLGTWEHTAKVFFDTSYLTVTVQSLSLSDSGITF